MIEGLFGNLTIENHGRGRGRACVSGRRNKTAELRTHGKTDEEPDARAERRQYEHGAQCDSIRIARGPLCFRGQCSN